MLCQNCEQNEANVHITRIINGEKTEVFLCEECAEEKGQFSLESEAFSFQNLLSGILNPDVSSSVSREAALKCENCGLKYVEFSETGILGCAECYDQFSERLEPLIKRIQGSSQHEGKVPKRKGGDLRLRNKLNHLREELDQVIAEENFEKAAELRDQIYELEDRLGSEQK